MSKPPFVLIDFHDVKRLEALERREALKQFRRERSDEAIERFRRALEPYPDWKRVFDGYPPAVQSHLARRVVSAQDFTQDAQDEQDDPGSRA